MNKPSVVLVIAFIMMITVLLSGCTPNEKHLVQLTDVTVVDTFKAYENKSNKYYVKVESPNIKNMALKAEDSNQWESFRPGQKISVTFDISTGYIVAIQKLN